MDDAAPQALVTSAGFQGGQAIACQLLECGMGLVVEASRSTNGLSQPESYLNASFVVDGGWSLS